MRGSRVAWVIVATVAGAACGSEVDTASGTVAPVMTTLATTGPATTSPVTTSPVTTSPVTTSPITTSPVTTSPVTTTPTAPWGIDGEWTAVAGTVDGAPVDIVAPITLEIDGTSFSGSSGCNSYEYVVGTDGDTVTFLEGFNTEIGCDGPVTEMEALYTGSIGPVAQVTQSGTTLVLQNERAMWTFEWVPPPPPATLTGTRWMLSGRWLGGAGGVSFIEGMEDGFLLLADDGTITGSTGCRPFAGTWAETDGRIVASIEPDGVCSGRLTGDDTTLLALLADGFVAELDDPRLLLLADDDTGYLFVAA